MAQSYAASKLNPNLAAIGTATIGVVFLGVPHRGCDMALWNAAVTPLSISVGPVSYSLQVVTDMSRGSAAVTSIATDFANGVIDKLQIYSFSEEFPSPMVNGTVWTVSPDLDPNVAL
jgi:hypothetical protein